MLTLFRHRKRDQQLYQVFLHDLDTHTTKRFYLENNLTEAGFEIRRSD